MAAGAVRSPLSYAARSGGRLRVQLQMTPADAVPGPAARLRLQRGERSVGAPASVERLERGFLLSAELPERRLRTGTWQLALRERRGRFRDLQAFVVVPPAGPVALLLGQPSSPELIRPRVRTRSQRVAGSLGRAADRALAQLPPSQARSARTLLRRTGRSVLGRR